MKSKRSLILAILALSFALSAPVLAQGIDTVRLGTPSYNGTGCPLGTISASLTPDGQSLSLMFGSFQVDAGGNTGRTIDRKACQIGIPVQVPQGISVSVIKIDYRGYNRLPLNASGTFDVEYFFAGQNGPAYHKSFVGATDGNFTLNNSLVATANVWSPCGADVNLRTNTSIAVQTNQFNEQAMLTLDSADITAGVIYQLSYKRCNIGQNPDQPQYPQPQQPNYPQQPQYPQPQYPQPTPIPQQLGPCVINSYNDSRGFQVFMVKDGTGRILGNTVQYAEALRIAQQSQQMGFCYGVVNNAQNPPTQPQYPQQPNYPQQPQQPQRYNSCQIMQGRNAYGQLLFRVVDRAGRILVTANSMQEAQRAQRNDSRCFQ
jgi:hypothetical protein